MWYLQRRDAGWRAARALTGYIVGLTACSIPVGLAFIAATFPGEWLDDQIPNWQWIPPNSVTAWLGAKDRQDKPIWTSFHDLLFDGELDETGLHRKSFFSNTLVLSWFDALEARNIDDPRKLDAVKHTLILRGRHLERAFFAVADLRTADLGGAHLQRAKFNLAQLQGSSLDFAGLEGASLAYAQLQGASLKAINANARWNASRN